MLLFYNGPIHTMDPACPAPEAVLVGDDGRIQSVGRQRDLATRAAARVDLRGRTLIPGFNDAHAHVVYLGLLLTRYVDVRIHVAPTIPAIIDRFVRRARTEPPGTWIIGESYNETFLPEGRHPTRHDLDRASGDHPLVLGRTCGHVSVANSKALELAGITSETPDPPGGVILRDERGEPTGVLQETAMTLVSRHIPEPSTQEMAEAIQAAMEHELQLGITSATDSQLSPFHVSVYRQMEADGQLGVRLNLLPVRREGERVIPFPERYVADMLRLDTIKFFADGGMTSATAAISIPYREVGTTGLLIYEREELAELMMECHRRGFRIATHANGDVALEQVIGIYERLQVQDPRPALRHRLEHMALPTADHLTRCARQGIMAATQTVFLPAMGPTFRRYMPPSFIPRAYGLRAMLDAGMTVALSTDVPVVPDDNPFLGLKAAVDRLDHAGVPFGPEQAVSPHEALHAYTVGGALLSGDAENRGSIAPGKWADLVVLSGDPLSVPPESYLDLQVVQTYVGGTLVYEM